MSEDPNVTLRIDFANGSRLGPGKAELLAKIAEHGSIRSAGAAMDMSYRRAWLLADEINRMFREPSVHTRHGGKSGGGAGLTEFGTELLALFQRMEAQARSANAADIARLRDATNPEFKSDAG